VGRAGRRAAHAERVRQLALTRHAGAQRQTPVEDQQADRPRERRVRRPARAPLAEQPGTMGSRERAIHRATSSELAMDFNANLDEDEAMIRRLLQLYLGLALYGLSMALMVRATLGLGPWDVFHDGVSGITGLSFGTVVILTSAAVLLAWIPLRQKPGIGTLSNVFLVGAFADLGLALIP